MKSFSKLAKRAGIVAATAMAVAACGDASGPNGSEETNTAKDSKFSVTCDSATLDNVTYEADALIFIPGSPAEPCDVPVSPRPREDAGAGGAGEEVPMVNANANDLYKLFSNTQDDPTSAFAKVSVLDCTVKKDELPTTAKGDIRQTTYTVTCNDGSAFNRVSNVLFSAENNGSCNTGKYELYKATDLKNPLVTVGVKDCPASLNK